MQKHLHIIAFTVPYPVDYGGVFDLFCKLPALKKQGIHVHLHCFDYGRGQQPELNKYCASVQYYERHTGSRGMSLSLPYIVSSRKENTLLDALLQDDYPILMEGIHCTYLLTDNRFQNRKCFVRLHNVEYSYYASLFRASSSLFKKIFYWREARLLKKHEKRIANRAVFWSVTQKDKDTYERELNCSTINHLPLFLPEWNTAPKEGMGAYCLYHGDLGIEANEKAALWLLQKVFNKLKIPLLIAGRNPSEKLNNRITTAIANATLVADPSENDMQDMIAKAHINIIPSYTNTGIKLKLINSLLNGRHCVVNEATVTGTGLEGLCHIADAPNAFRELITQLYLQPFSAAETTMRNKILGNIFDAKRNAEQMINAIWPELIET